MCRRQLQAEAEAAAAAEARGGGAALLRRMTRTTSKFVYSLPSLEGDLAVLCKP